VVGGVDRFGPPFNHSPKQIRGQSKDGRKPIAKVDKQVRGATSKRTEHPNRHYPVDINVWSRTELEWKEARGKRLPTGDQQDGQRDYRNATVHPLGNPNRRERPNPSDHTSGSQTITLCPKTAETTSRNQRSKRGPTANQEFSSISTTKPHEPPGGRPGRRELPGNRQNLPRRNNAGHQ
jgi:hypothetical protein